MGCCSKKPVNLHSDLEDYESSNRIWLTVMKWFFIILIILLVVAFIVFIHIFVILPIAFMDNIEIQRMVMFLNYNIPEKPEYTNYELYEAVGVNNFYITVNDIDPTVEKIKLGAWQVVPESIIEETKNPNFNFLANLKNTKKPVVLYFHGNSGTRIYAYNTYKILRKFFHVIAFDYRGYADSTKALLTEKAVVSDALQVYKWVLNNTGNNNDKRVYIWGHSLGTALSTHTVKRIYQEDNIIFPKGLILEAPFTSMRDEISYHPAGKIFAWLPWFNSTIRNPLEKNGFHFNTSSNILSVKCPVMILHAEDDSMIPYTLGKKLYETAKKNKINVIYHQVPASEKCDHNDINKWPKLPDKIKEFLKLARPLNKETPLEMSRFIK